MKRSTKQFAPASPSTSSEMWDPFEAVPVIADGVEAREDQRGMIQLRRTVRGAGCEDRLNVALAGNHRVSPLGGGQEGCALKRGPHRFAAWFGRLFRSPRHARINLDAYGTMFWRQIDGARSLREIEGVIRDVTQQDQKQSEQATILFTKMLMLRRLIYLNVPSRAQDRP